MIARFASAVADRVRATAYVLFFALPIAVVVAAIDVASTGVAQANLPSIDGLAGQPAAGVVLARVVHEAPPQLPPSLLLGIDALAAIVVLGVGLPSLVAPFPTLAAWLAMAAGCFLGGFAGNGLSLLREGAVTDFIGWCQPGAGAPCISVSPTDLGALAGLAMVLLAVGVETSSLAVQAGRRRMALVEDLGRREAATVGPTA